MSRTFWFIVLGLLLATLLVAGFLLSHEPVSEEEPIPPRPLARDNPFLAAGRLLEGLDIAVRELTSLQSEPGPATRAALVLPAPRGALGHASLVRLEAFVREGGHLLVEAELLGNPDPLLDLFDIERVSVPQENPLFTYRRSAASWLDLTGSDGSPWTTRFEPDDGTAALHLRMHSPVALSAWQDGNFEDVEFLWGTAGPFEPSAALQIEWGKGRVSVFNGMGWMQNRGIGRFDHAEFLHWLLRSGGGVDEVVFLRSWHGGPLHWLRQHFAPALLALAVLLALALWRLLPGFGPIAPDPPPVRRRLLEHLAASGRLLWSRHSREALAGAAAAHALARLKQDHPHTALLAPEALAAFLMRRFSLDAGQAGLLAGQARPGHAAGLLELARACRRVHLGLARRRHPADPLYHSEESPP